MKQFLRRLRGVIGTGLTWAIGWAGFSAVVGVIFGAYSVPRLALVGAFTGLIAGGAFAVILSITERRRRLEDLSLWLGRPWWLSRGRRVQQEWRPDLGFCGDYGLFGGGF